MRQPLPKLLFALCFGLIASKAAFGQASATADFEKVALEIGDHFEITVERHGISKKFSGTLVDFDSRWLVLHTVLDTKPMPREPKVSIAAQMFDSIWNRLSFCMAVQLLGASDNVGIGRTAQFHWLPREAATITRQTIISDKPEIEPPDGLPNGLCGFAVQFVRDGHAVEWFAAHTFSESGLTCRREIVRDEHHQVPVLGRLPYIGWLFHSTTQQVRTEHADCPWDDVICITDGA